MTTYREIPGFPGYRAGDDGSVQTCRKRYYGPGMSKGVRYVFGNEWVPLKVHRLKAGYLDVILYRDGKGYHRLVHRLVLLAFRGECPPNHEAFHENDKRDDCSLLNLRWATKTENQQHRRKRERERGHVDVRNRKATSS